MDLKGRVALVTGSGRNIGRATALELARRGADVILNARSDTNEIESVAQEARTLGVRALPLVADVGKEMEVSKMIDAAMNMFNRVDILVNNAGLRMAAPITDMSTADWRSVLAVNLDGPFFCSRAVIPGMMKSGWGRIINVSGMNAHRGRENWSHVCSSKMGALGLTRALAKELAPFNILVNHIVPGAFDTAQQTSNTVSNDELLDWIPLRRLGLVEELAKTCGFLASDDASYITGQTIHVNGGALST